jgi:hypothetical protein
LLIPRLLWHIQRLCFLQSNRTCRDINFTHRNLRGKYFPCQNPGKGFRQ